MEFFTKEHSKLESKMVSLACINQAEAGRMDFATLNCQGWIPALKVLLPKETENGKIAEVRTNVKSCISLILESVKVSIVHTVYSDWQQFCKV